MVHTVIFANAKRQPDQSAWATVAPIAFSTGLLRSLLALCAFVLLATLSAMAQSSYTVTRFDDTASVDTDSTHSDTYNRPGLGPGAYGDLRYGIRLAINSYYSGDNHKYIYFPSSCTPSSPCKITLSGPLLLTNSYISHLELTIDGGEFGNVIIDGANAYRIFFADVYTKVTLANLQIQNAMAKGGNGGKGYHAGGGGGLGAGACLFVNYSSVIPQTVIIHNTYFYNCQAIGGSGGWGLGDPPVWDITEYPEHGGTAAAAGWRMTAAKQVLCPVQFSAAALAAAAAVCTAPEALMGCMAADMAETAEVVVVETRVTTIIQLPAGRPMGTTALPAIPRQSMGEAETAASAAAAAVAASRQFKGVTKITTWIEVVETAASAAAAAAV